MTMTTTANGTANGAAASSQRAMAARPIRVGCVGGGQLGRMMALEAPRVGIQMKFLDPTGVECPAAQVVPHKFIVEGSLKDPSSLRELARDVDVLTVEIEHCFTNRRGGSGHGYRLEPCGHRG